MASLRTRVQLALVDLWQSRGPAAWLLAPLSVIHWVGYTARRALHRRGMLRQARLDVPVVVIGNLYVGGTGKTPLTIELVRALRDRGWRPGIVSRGYGGAGARARLVTEHDTARDVGDEPLLIARSTLAPVVVARDRAAAARLLRARHPECDVVIADDGLQHWALGRDMEIALVHYRGLGNGWLLPAGPLREPRRRLDEVNAIVCNGEVPAIRATAPRYVMRTRLGAVRPLDGRSAPQALSALATAQRRDGLRIVAAAGIGMPDRFFAMLRDAGLEIEELPLADHFDFVENPFAGLRADCILVTEKDAVKCVANPELADDPRIRVVPLATEIEPRFIDAVAARLQELSRRSPLGPSAA
jgi:tetraacyldisaccharide 4'-kinase